MKNFEDLLQACDPVLFQGVYSQLEPGDMRSILALQNVIRERGKTYTYLEIGSYMGGSIQTHLLDPRCTRIYSIDNRPYTPSDGRGRDLPYPHNSTSLMLKNLEAIGPQEVTKVTCLEATASEVNRSSITERPDFCFIDGEHTEEAVIADFALCRTVLQDGGIICFHDSNIVFGGIHTIIDGLKREGVVFSACILPFTVFVIELGSDLVRKDPRIVSQILDNHTAYIGGLELMEHYRDVFNSRPVKALRFVHRRLLEIQKPSLILARLREILLKS